LIDFSTITTLFSIFRLPFTARNGKLETAMIGLC